MGNYGEFEENVEEGIQEIDEQGIPIRVRTPRKGEFIGIVLQRLGGNRMEVKSSDGKLRNCRVPGKFKRSMWLRDRDIVLVKPWPDDDSKADIVFQYKPNAANQLRKRGLLDSLREEF